MANGSALYPSPPEDNGTSYQASGLTDSPLFDDLDDGNFEWDGNADQLFGDLQDNDFNDDGELHDKRKASIDSEDEEQGSNKKQEGDSKTPKKPGRKPLTAEPTTKRKAQNRAAQRAFRERKERHLKDLETKVEDLEKASEATNHENGRLRGQVDKLNVELTEYRKRLSLNSTGVSQSPPAPPKRNSSQNNDFTFAFPKFGDLPGASFLNNGSLARTSSASQTQMPATAASVRKASSTSANSYSPSSINGAYPTTNYTSPQNSIPSPPNNTVPTPTTSFTNFTENSLDDLTGLFSPSVLGTASSTSSTDYLSFNGGGANNGIAARPGTFGSNHAVNQPPKLPRQPSASATNSPASSMSHVGFDSSVGTTPEATVDSPDNKDYSNVDKTAGNLNTISEENSLQNLGKKKLCNSLATACGNSPNPIPPMMSGSNAASAPLTGQQSYASEINGIDWFAQQNGGQFDPVLYGDYRDPQDNILNSIGDDFFNDAFPAQDFASPYNTGDALASEPKRDLMKEIEVKQSGTEDEVAPREQNKEYVGYDTLWSCSGKGAVIEKKDVDSILGPAKKQNDMFGGFA
ncbi:uncharacterized protein KY384_002787 [Bacidia gigantensis]|uniref:uncharacterized protein n=1 Tax=Bacidia gigantensis TaxID=2732470 RepID=UPI001D040FE0|nr:uncharacterized protein KY384_002787 [Bacidia gigantensis]KAG8532909.1 hypothetical protein KY384_002787 [Bacidia gigantensis]